MDQVFPVLLNFPYKADSVCLVPPPLRQRFNMFILSRCWQAPQHVSLSVYMNAGKELICILSVCFCVRGHLFAPYIRAKTDTSWGVLSHHRLLNLICDAFTFKLLSNKATSVHFLCLTALHISLPPREVFTQLLISSSLTHQRYCLVLSRFSGTKAVVTKNRKDGVGYVSDG